MGVRPWIGLRARLAAAALVLLHGVAAEAGVQLSPRLAEPPQAIVATLVVNGARLGDRVVFRVGAQDFLLKLADLAALVQLPPGTEGIEIEGESHARPATLYPGTTLHFDESRVELVIDFPARAFPSRSYDIGSRRARASDGAPGSSALFNYRLGHAGGDGGEAWTLAAEQALRQGRWLARNVSQHVYRNGSTTSVRYETQLVRDDRAGMRRLTLGDAVTPPGELGTSLQIGGISYARAWQLSPYFVRQPALGFAGSVSLPSQLDLYVGGARVLQRQVPPGPFEIDNFNYYGGQQDVRVVIRDPLGREQAIEYPFYFSERALARGLHDYSYHLGYLRERFGSASGDYGPAAFAGFHEYGLTDSISLSLRGEGTSRRGNAGPGVALRHDRLGLLSLSAAGSWDRATGEGGSAVAAAHSWQFGGVASALLWRRFADRYARLAPVGSAPLPRTQFSGSLGYSARGFGALSLRYDRRSAAGDQAESRRATLVYSRPLAGQATLLASIRRGFEAQDDDEVMLGLLYVPRGRHTAAAFFRHDAQSDKAQLQLASRVPTGEGGGYRLGIEHDRGSLGASTTIVPEVQYNARHATLMARAHHQSGSVEAASWSVDAAGAIVMVGGSVLTTRAVGDSFALAQLDPPLAGVRVYQSSQEIGRTDAQGRLLLPNIGSYVDNDVTIEPQDIPIEYTIQTRGKVIAPGFRGGALADFRVTRIRSITGTLSVGAAAGARRPLEFAVVTLGGGADGTRFMTGRGGAFYLEQLAAGTYPARTHIGENSCEFQLTVPDVSESFISLGDILACDGF